MDRVWVRVRAAMWLLAISLALVGMPASALAARGPHQTPDPRPLWHVYPLGTQALARSTGLGPATAGSKPHKHPIARSADGYASPIGLSQLLTIAALVCILAAIAPIAVRRRWSRPQRATAGAVAVAPRRASTSQVTAREELTAPLRAARRELIDSQPVRPDRPPATRDEAIVEYAAAYAAASQRGERAPMAAVRAIVPPATQDPAAYAKRVIAEARRRGLLTSHGRGRAQGELTPKALDLLERARR